MNKFKLAPLALFVLSYGVFAQQLPSGGSQLQQLPPDLTPAKTIPKLSIEPSNAVVSPAMDTTKIMVKRLNVTGAHIYSQSELLDVIGFVEGSELTLTELRLLAAKISVYYHFNGYFVAQAYLPQQDIENGLVTIAVIEGNYGKVVLQNKSGLSDNVANKILGGLNSGDVISAAPLEKRLLLLSDLRGVKVKSTLVPGATFGTSDLIIELNQGKTITGSIDADNAGSRYTGEYRVGATVNMNNLAGLGDMASLRVLTSGSGMKYARISYEVPIGKAFAGVAYSSLDYALEKEFEFLGAHGKVDIATIYGGYSLIRSRDTNLVAHVNFDAKKFEDSVDVTSSVTNKKINVLTASLVGDHRDKFAGGGINSYSLAWSSGKLDIETPAARMFDSLYAKTNGSFNKLSGSVMRLQNVTESVSLYGSVSGQIASKNLDISEKMSLGGMYGVRAYPVGEAYGDQGYLMTLEARYLLSDLMPQIPCQMHVSAFIDSGTVMANKNVWDSSIDNERTLSGSGIGASCVAQDNFSVKAYYSRKIGSEPAISAPDKSGRFWIQAVKYF